MGSQLPLALTREDAPCMGQFQDPCQLGSRTRPSGASRPAPKSTSPCGLPGGRPLPYDSVALETEQGFLLCQGSGLPRGRCDGSAEARLLGCVCGQPVPANLVFLMSALPVSPHPCSPGLLFFFPSIRQL